MYKFTMQTTKLIFKPKRQSLCTDKKEKIIFLVYKGTQMGSGALRKGFLIYKEMLKYLTIYEEAVSHI